jgi:hypothetical protein
MCNSAARLVLFTVLAGCTGDTISAPVQEPVIPQASKSVVPQPITGSCHTQFDPPPFPLPLVLRQTDTGTCTLSHLGRAGIYSVQDIDFATGTQKSIELRFTAANGDVLLAGSVGSSVPGFPDLRFQGTITFAGGSGRFAGATGQATIAGNADLIRNTAQFEIVERWLDYRAADRSN